MSPRPKRTRILKEPPTFSGFFPMGGEYDTKSVVVLHFEEYEALRLSDYQSLNQEEAANQLQVSRPTYTRIYSAARKKVATALAENRPIVVTGGDVEFDTRWYECKNCSCVFKAQEEKMTMDTCPVCNSEEIIPVQQAGEHRNFGEGRGRKSSHQGEEMCICPKCDHEIPHQMGIPCNSNLCPKCNIRMMRKGSNRHAFVLKKRQNKES
ncbi:MAG: DUF134 domain-containing protein [Bacteroidales bacterium]|nr:DUF134 domain-containing protein [Bacteroidales bacterium]